MKESSERYLHLFSLAEFYGMGRVASYYWCKYCEALLKE